VFILEIICLLSFLLSFVIGNDKIKFFLSTLFIVTFILIIGGLAISGSSPDWRNNNDRTSTWTSSRNSSGS